jgi:hypothetical protein
MYLRGYPCDDEGEKDMSVPLSLDKYDDLNFKKQAVGLA